MTFSQLKKEFKKVGCKLGWIGYKREYEIDHCNGLVMVARSRSEVEEELNFITKKRDWKFYEQQEDEEIKIVDEIIKESELYE